MLIFASFLVDALGLYAALGFAFALAFITRGLDAIEAGASGGTWGFKLLIVPGCVLLWPWLLRRWIVRSQAR